MKAIWRAAAILRDPFAEWAKIETEPDDPGALMFRYVALFALVPALAGFVGACIIGTIAPAGAVVRAPLFDGIFGAIFGYLEAFATTLLLGLVIALAAPLFGGRTNFAGALKLAVYSYTPAWLTGIFLLLPGLRFLMLGGFYGAYLLLAGLPRVTKSPPSKSPAFAALIVAFACALTLLAAALQRMLFASSVGL